MHLLICQRCLTLHVPLTPPKLGEPIKCEHCSSQWITITLVNAHLPEGWVLTPETASV